MAKRTAEAEAEAEAEGKMMGEPLSTATERLLQLSFLPGVGAVTLRKLTAMAKLSGLGSLAHDDEIVANLPRGSNRTGKQNGNGWKEVIERCYEHGIRILSTLDEDYPGPLAHIEDFPPILYVKGSSVSLRKLGCAVVGTREASQLGFSWARQIAELFASRGYSVVSGLALGIDTAAHQGALRASGGSTVAVLAHGLDQVTPASNRPLAASIIEAGGSLVSEHPPGMPPRRAEFVRRNRIQSGMSVCSVVVESGEAGGAIHQGHFTAQQGRRLYCVVPDASVPGSDEFRYGGARQLMKDSHAVPIRCRDELTKLMDSGQLEFDFSKLKNTSTPAGSMV